MTDAERLTEATALLVTIRARLISSHPESASDIDAFLSQTPAPAATPALTGAELADRYGFQPHGLASDVAAATPAPELRRWHVGADIDDDGADCRNYAQTPPDGNICWHCGDMLQPMRQRCERCPDECDTEGCEQPGCAPEQPPAPEPSAVTNNPDYCRGYTDGVNDGAREILHGQARDNRLADAVKCATDAIDWHARMVTAESQLAAVRDVCLRACPDGRSSVHISTADLWPLLSPGGGTGAP